jgi:hypothetical protein
MEEIKIKIGKVLDDAETVLRDIMIDATRRGEYADVDLARSVASQLSRLGLSLLSHEEASATPGMNGTVRKHTESNRSLSKRQNRVTTKRAEYPRFAVEGETLTLIGWSKKSREEYSHKVPRVAFDTIAQAMSRLAQKNRAPFTSDELWGETQASNPSIAQYQVYTVLRMLRHTGCVEKRGRAGHSWTKQIEQRARKAWNDCAGVKSI